MNDLNQNQHEVLIEAPRPSTPVAFLNKNATGDEYVVVGLYLWTLSDGVHLVFVPNWGMMKTTSPLLRWREAGIPIPIPPEGSK